MERQNVVAEFGSGILRAIVPWEKYSRPVVMLVATIPRGWGVTKQELFQVPLERKCRALSNHPTNNNF